MEITPAVGLGDIIYWKIYSKNSGIAINQININMQLLREHKQKSDQYLNFLFYFIKKLFPETKINCIPSYHTRDYPNFVSIPSTYLLDSYVFDKLFHIPYSDYIVFHTKARFDNASHIYRNEKELLKDFFSTFKTNKTIILMGEKIIEDCPEKFLHNIESAYDITLQLKNNNNVIDITKDYLYSGNDSIDDFEKDLQIINNASCNVTLGFGGNVNLCLMASKNTIGYVSCFQYFNIVDLVKNNNNKLFNNIDLFFSELQKID